MPDLETLLNLFFHFRIGIFFFSFPNWIQNWCNFEYFMEATRHKLTETPLSNASCTFCAGLEYKYFHTNNRFCMLVLVISLLRYHHLIAHNHCKYGMNAIEISFSLSISRIRSIHLGHTDAAAVAAVAVADGAFC